MKTGVNSTPYVSLISSITAASTRLISDKLYVWYQIVPAFVKSMSAKYGARQLVVVGTVPPLTGIE